MNQSDQPLRTALLDLHHAIQDQGIRLILGGGYGLYLKQLDAQGRPDSGSRWLPPSVWPQPRSTEDIDLFLTIEVVSDLSRMQGLRAALDSLGFQPVPEAKFMQFYRAAFRGRAGQVKIDLLTGPIPEDPDVRRLLKVNQPRVRPQGDIELHAYLAKDAIGFSENTTPLLIEGCRSDGALSRADIFIPPAASMLLMKIHAFHDRRSDADKALGRHHALDVFRIVAMLTESEFDMACAMIVRCSHLEAVKKAKAIVAIDFADQESLGTLRLREHLLFRADRSAITRFIAGLRAIFGFK